MLTEAEIERRLPIWVALADLFLDTELQPEDYGRIAATLKKSGYSTDALRHMLDTEVAPAFVFNLYSIAGEWAGWDEDFVRDRVLHIIGNGTPGLLRKYMTKRLSRYGDREWEKLVPLLKQG